MHLQSASRLGIQGNPGESSLVLPVKLRNGGIHSSTDVGHPLGTRSSSILGRTFLLAMN